MKFSCGAPLVGLLLMACCGGQSFAQQGHGKMSRDAVQAAANDTVPVIVQYAVRPGSGHVQRISDLGGKATRVFATIPAIAARVPGSAISLLAQEPSVKYITIDRPVGSKAAWYSAEPVNAPSMWFSGLLGTGVSVAVIDSGITSSMQDLAYSPLIPGSQHQKNNQRVLFQHNFLTDKNGNPLPATNDLYGHGTHVAGIIAGDGTRSIGNQFFRSFVGIAPNANLIDLQVLDQNGVGTDSNVIAAIEMAIALKNTYNIRVINLSLGRPVFESSTQDPLCQAVEQAWMAGIVVVVAAGNDGRLQTINPEGYGTINSPGNDPYVITAGAINTNGTATIQDDTVASYSSKGPSLVDDIAKPDLMAPGSQIASLRNPSSTLVQQNPTLVTLMSDYSNSGGPAKSTDYFPLSGTSMATAVTSGAAALLLQAVPQLTPDQVKAFLMRDANKTVFPYSSTVTDSTGSYTSYDDVLTIGAGYLNIEASVADARQNTGNLPAGYALSPEVILNPVSDTMSLLFDQGSLWNDATSWAPAVVYGSQVFLNDGGGSTLVWAGSRIAGSTIIWGRSSLLGSTIIWGRMDLIDSTIIWGRSAADDAEVTPMFPY